jgi:hypothetical protein
MLKTKEQHMQMQQLLKKNANATISGFSNRKNITNAIEVKKP